MKSPPPDDLFGRFGATIDTRPQFGRVRTALTATVAELTAEDWQQPTACAPWLVRDVVAHIVGDDLARLSRSRDGLASAGPAPGQSLPAFLHRHNQDWVDATRRMSPALLGDLLGVVTPQVLDFWRQADLAELGEAVSWASPEPAPVWLDCARDFTEYWTHLHQILDATGRPPLADDDALHGVLDTFARALPLTLQRAAPVIGGTVTIRVPGPAGGSWTCAADKGAWRWAAGPAAEPTAAITIGADTLWRLCTRGIEPADAVRHADVQGDRRLAAAALQMVSIIR